VLEYSRGVERRIGCRLRRWASAVLIACLLGVGPALFLLDAASMLVQDRHVRRGAVIYIGAEARWAAAGLIAWAMAMPAYAWFELRRGAADRRTRRPLVVPLVFCLTLLAAGFACTSVAWSKSDARFAAEEKRMMERLPPELQDKAKRILEGSE
jgi:hypothetical protein